MSAIYSSCTCESWKVNTGRELHTDLHTGAKRERNEFPRSSQKTLDCLRIIPSQRRPCPFHRWGRPSCRGPGPRGCRGRRRCRDHPQRGRTHSRRGKRTCPSCVPPVLSRSTAPAGPWRPCRGGPRLDTILKRHIILYLCVSMLHYTVVRSNLFPRFSHQKFSCGKAWESHYFARLCFALLEVDIGSSWPSYWSKNSSIAFLVTFLHPNLMERK